MAQDEDENEKKALLSGTKEDYQRSEGWLKKILSIPLRFRSSKIITVEPMIFLYTFAMYFTFPISQQFIYQYYTSHYLKQVNDSTYSNVSITGICLNENISAIQCPGYSAMMISDCVRRDASHMVLYQTVLATVFMAMSILLLGPMTDRYGRKLAMIVPAIGSAFSFVFILIVIYFNVSLYLILAGAIVNGISGGLGGTLMGGFTYISDVSSPRTRTLRMGVATSMVFLAGALSEYLGGLWLQKNNCSYQLLFWTSIGINFVEVLYIIIGFPDSKQNDLTDNISAYGTLRRKSRFSSLIVIVKAAMLKLWRGIRIFFRLEIATVELWLAVLINAVYVVITTGTQTTAVVFFKGSPLKWEPLAIGEYDAVSFATHGGAIILILPILTLLRFPDPLIGLISLSSAVCYFFIAFLGMKLLTWQMFLLGGLTCLEALIAPAMRSLLSKRVAKSELGNLFSVVGCVEIVSAAIAGAVYNGIYPILKQNTFYLNGLLYGLSTPLLVVLLILHVVTVHKCCSKEDLLTPTQSSSTISRISNQGSVNYEKY